ncbi:hypothetical protein [uncultured Sphingomonas sp.]|uniref:hypothetical protein n=1 Tax=uncultured Sphingomonas sp. TaxID=158754 RepID=UPI0025FD02D5|nr:hypothetical protein [uncultured Sphingomonas sp.]
MARIRSIHPGLWTDEAFVSLTPYARLLFMGIWTECDDMGSFEWSPLKLKMRLLPADNIDAAALMAELQAADAIMAYDEGGKRYGAVRNFCQYQRPKKPNSIYPQTEAVRKYVGTEARSTRDGSEPDPVSTPPSSPPPPLSSAASGEPVGNQLPTGGEKCRQMEDGGGRSSSVANATGASPPKIDDPQPSVFDTGVALLVRTGSKPKPARGLIAKWIRATDEDWTLRALASAEGRADPVAWIEARLKSHQSVEDEARAISHATAERYRRMAIPGPPAGNRVGEAIVG